MIDVLSSKIASHPSIKNITPKCALLEDPDDPILRVADAGNGSRRFDVIVCHLTLHHIPDLHGIFALMLALLKPGGMSSCGPQRLEDMDMADLACAM